MVGDRGEDLIGRLLERCSFPVAGTAVTCGVSGGADSLSLLVLSVAAGCEVTAVHVDHGLRPDSANDALVVAEAARRFGAGFRSVRVEVGDGPNLEARARAARHEVLGDALLGHTADDQAETVLWFLARGTGPEGLAGIDPTRRPLLGLRRRETAELCAVLGIDALEDPANADPRFTRNRIRSELISLFNDIARRDVVPAIAAAARHQRDLIEGLDELARNVDPTDARSVAGSARPVAVTAMRQWWRREVQTSYAPDAAALERMLAVARGDRPRADVVAGWQIARTAQRLRLVPPSER